MLSEVSESQWGMVTTAQVNARGVSHMNLTRLTESGDLVRLSHGVYRDAGAPSDQYEGLRSAWLATEPDRFAWERLTERPGTAVVSGESASRLHGIGEFRAMKSEFTTPRRKQTQRPDVRYRTRELTSDDVTVREGLPVTTRERTISDLVEDRQDLSLVGHVLRDAARQSRLDVDRLTDLLNPLAERNGYRRGDGEALLENLMRLAGIDPDSIAKQLAGLDVLGALITEQYLQRLTKIDVMSLSAAIAEQIAAALPVETYSRLSAEIVETLSKVTIPALTNLSGMSGIASSGLLNTRVRLAEQLKAVDWTALALATQRPRREVEQ